MVKQPSDYKLTIDCFARKENYNLLS